MTKQVKDDVDVVDTKAPKLKVHVDDDSKVKIPK